METFALSSFSRWLPGMVVQSMGAASATALCSIRSSRTVDRVVREERIEQRAVAEAAPIDWTTIPGNQREKLDRAKVSIRKELEKGFRTRFLAEADQYRAQCDANVAAYKAKLDAQAERERARRDQERRFYDES